MVRYLRATAFLLIVLMAITALRPFNAADTFAAELPIYGIVLTDEEGTATIHETSVRTVGAFLNEMEIEIGPYDIVHPHYNRRMEDNLEINIDRGFYITVVIDGTNERRQVSPGTTSGELLNTMQQGMESALLYEGNESQVLTEGDTIHFYTWRSEVIAEVDYIPYQTEYEVTPMLYIGERQVRRAGTQGERRREYTIVFVGGQEYAREFIREYVVPAVPQVVARGSASSVDFVLGALTDTASPDFRYSRRITMEATAYTAYFCCTGKHPGDPWFGITASGRHVEHGIVAVDRTVIPLGTQLYVEGYGFALAADVGSAIRGYKIDLFMYNVNDARRFGRRDVTVFVLD